MSMPGGMLKGEWTCLLHECAHLASKLKEVRGQKALPASITEHTKDAFGLEFATLKKTLQQLYQ